MENFLDFIFFKLLPFTLIFILGVAVVIVILCIVSRIKEKRLVVNSHIVTRYQKMKDKENEN